MDTQVFFKYKLNEAEKEKITNFCNSAEYCAIEQLIGWTEMFFKSKICYFWLEEESEIKSYCQVQEKWRSAQIYFGPVCSDKDLMVRSLDEIIKYYKKKKFYYIGIQMYFKTGYDSDYIEYLINNKYKIRYFFNGDNTRSSIELDLSNSVDDIWQNLRSGHKKNIKKNLKLGTTVEIVRDEAGLKSFSDIYYRMCKVRNIDDSELTSENINEIYRFLKDKNKGDIILIKDQSGVVLGGAILVYQGITVRYMKGASDPERKELPVLHQVIYEAVLSAKKNNFRYFDFWGYTHFVNEDDQLYNINQFKKGFGGYYTFLAKKMNVSLVPFGYYIYKSMMFVKRLVAKNLKNIPVL
jgi:lipid II:glycine glycyltransferase (peptidoglycan interpeptide bridge formation enzyme)